LGVIKYSIMELCPICGCVFKPILSGCQIYLEEKNCFNSLKHQTDHIIRIVKHKLFEQVSVKIDNVLMFSAKYTFSEKEIFKANWIDSSGELLVDNPIISLNQYFPFDGIMDVYWSKDIQDLLIFS
jgi:hypothetical protein